MGIIVIGLAIDYTLHFMHVYEEAGGHSGSYHLNQWSRQHRVEFALENIGSTIFAGFASSFAAGVFLYSFSLSPFFSQMVGRCVLWV